MKDLHLFAEDDLALPVADLKPANKLPPGPTQISLDNHFESRELLLRHDTALRVVCDKNRELMTVPELSSGKLLFSTSKALRPVSCFLPLASF